MKHLPVLVLLIAASVSISAQRSDFSTIDGLVDALYASISGPAGERDWEFFHSLYRPEAIMGAMRKTPGGDVVYNGFSPAEYVANNGPFFQKNGFWEEELHRETIEYGEMAHVFSSYEFRTQRDGEEVRQRGINSIQLVFESGRWWIVSIQWNSERDDLPLPRKFAKRS